MLRPYGLVIPLVGVFGQTTPVPPDPPGMPGPPHPNRTKAVVPYVIARAHGPYGFGAHQNVRARFASPVDLDWWVT